MPFEQFLLESGPIGAATSILAYLDPGTGSYAVQLLLAGLFGGLFFVKQSWAGFKLWFGARPSNVARPKIDDRTSAATR